MTHYDGGFRAHSQPEEEGTFILTPGAEWGLHFATTQEWIHGNLANYSLQVTPSGPSSCHVTFRDPQDPDAGASFDLPETSSATVDEALPSDEPDRWIWGLIARYRLRASAAGPSSCHVTVTDVQLPTVSAGLDLPETSLEVFQQELRRQLQAPQQSPPLVTPDGKWVSYDGGDHYVANTGSLTAPPPTRPVSAPQSASEQYYAGKLRGQRHRRAARLIGTTACCGIPCLLTTTLVLGLMSAALLFLARI
jgi:hypothetical protein